MMLENLTLEAILPVVSGGIGFVFRQFAEATRRQFEMAKEKSILSRESHDAAAKRAGKGGTWMRRAIYLLIAGMFAAIVIAGFMKVPVVVETDVHKGILFWQKVVKEFVTIDGVLFPVEIRQGFLALLGFYLGQGVK